MGDRVRIFDTTLRDGEQSPGATLTVDEKAEIAIQLARLGVDVIEAGFPISSPGDFEAVRRSRQRSKGPRSPSPGLARGVAADVDRPGGGARGRAPAHPRVHLDVRYPLDAPVRKTARGARAMPVDGRPGPGSYLTTTSSSRRWTPPAPSRDYLLRGATRRRRGWRNDAQHAGHGRLHDAEEYAALSRQVEARRPPSDRRSTATTTWAWRPPTRWRRIQAGAPQVEVTVNGLGERAGNASLEEIVMASARAGQFGGATTGVETEQLTATSRLVSYLTGIVVQPNKSVVGANAFAHESGIHQDGFLKNPLTYEIMTPESVGLSGSTLTLGKLSGRAGFDERLRRLGITSSPRRWTRCTARPLAWPTGRSR